MYDMYPWDSRAQDARAAQTPHAREAAQAAVQVALDRRDNGGSPADEAK